MDFCASLLILALPIVGINLKNENKVIDIRLFCSSDGWL